MLDTIALTLERGEFEIAEPGRFSPSALGLLQPPYYPLGGRGAFACVQNPTKKDFAEGRYGPRLTLTKRASRGGFNLTLRVEFSAPKLIFGNNFDELRSRDFDEVVDRLRSVLGNMGVRVSDYGLRATRVSAVHYSKNMAFTDFTSCSMVIRELDRIDLDRRLDLSHTDYRNEGHAIRYHANSFEVTFYDKLKDLQKARVSEKRAVEGDYTGQMGLFDQGGGFPKQLEVLRMEVRLGSRRKIRSVMQRIGAEIEPTFAALFDASIAKDVLLHFWAEVRRQMAMLGNLDQRPEDLFAALATAGDGQVRPSALLQQLGCIMLARSIGARGADALVTRHCSQRSWQRWKRQLKTLPTMDATGFSALAVVDDSLQAFRPLRLKDLRQIQPGAEEASDLVARKGKSS